MRGIRKKYNKIKQGIKLFENMEEGTARVAVPVLMLLSFIINAEIF